jgi:hypothetical protein
VVSGTERGPLHMIDVIFSREGGQSPDIIVADTGYFRASTSSPTSTTGPTVATIKGIRNLQEGRHSLAGAIFHGKKRELYQRTTRGWRISWGRSGWSSTAWCCGTPST